MIIHSCMRREHVQHTCKPIFKNSVKQRFVSILLTQCKTMICTIYAWLTGLLLKYKYPEDLCFSDMLTKQPYPMSYKRWSLKYRHIHRCGLLCELKILFTPNLLPNVTITVEYYCSYIIYYSLSSQSQKLCPELDHSHKRL